MQVKSGLSSGENHMCKQLGLIGFPLKHSFSRAYFSDKFIMEGILNFSYETFELTGIEMLPELIRSHPLLIGLNVTIPYKQGVMPYLDFIDPTAEKIGAVNTIRIKTENGKRVLEGYNTDAAGFSLSLSEWLCDYRPSALVLGTGGASKAITYVLDNLKIPYRQVTRKSTIGCLTYDELNEKIIHDFKLLINCTPLGTFPNIEDSPPIPYNGITGGHYLYDLVYNPELTAFLRKGLECGASIKNGLEMLHNQAIAAWEIWNG